jgi:hypothetical protein
MAGVVDGKRLDNIFASCRRDEEILSERRVLNGHDYFKPPNILHLSPRITQQQEIQNAILDDRIKQTIDFYLVVLW